MHEGRGERHLNVETTRKPIWRKGREGRRKGLRTFVCLSLAALVDVVVHAQVRQHVY